jgi:uncharacterized glyoxalase superfamily protein PhnB
MQLKPAIPVFRIFDSALAKKFYIDWLGFKIDWEHQFDAAAPRYFQISRDNAVLHLSEHFGDCSPGAKALINVDDIEAFHRELQSRPNPNMRPGLETQDWGAKTVTVIDPFYNRIVFSQPIKK